MTPTGFGRHLWLASKADIGDMRESPALGIARDMTKNYPGPLWAIEPNVGVLPDGSRNAELSEAEAAAQADVHVKPVDHAPFKAMAAPVGKIVDTRGSGEHPERPGAGEFMERH